MAAMAPHLEPMSKNWNTPSNRSTKRSVETIGVNGMNGLISDSVSDSSAIRSAIHEINKNSVTLGNNRRDQNRDHSSYSRHREMHKTLEKNRRAHLRHCFEVLKDELPPNEYNEKKSSHINIISCAIRYIQHLKRTETELNNQTERLVRTKIRFQTQIAQLMDDLKDLNYESELSDAIQYEGHSDGNSDGHSDELSDEEVIIELRAEDHCYDDETTTTASGKARPNDHPTIPLSNV